MLKNYIFKQIFETILQSMKGRKKWLILAIAALAVGLSNVVDIPADVVTNFLQLACE